MTKDAQSVLRIVSQKAADGYTIQSRTGLNADQLVGALQELISSALVQIEGDLNPSAIGGSYIWVPTDKKGDAELASRFPPSS